jgi:hypothetical protein
MRIAGELWLTTRGTGPTFVLIATRGTVLIGAKSTRCLFKISGRIALQLLLLSLILRIDQILPICFDGLRAGHARMPYSTIPTDGACIHTDTSLIRY